MPTPAGTAKLNAAPAGVTRRALVFVGTLDEPRVAGVLREAGLDPVAAVDPTTFPAGPLSVAVIDPELLGARPTQALEAVVGRLAGAPVIFLCGPCEHDRLAALIGLPTTLAIVPRDHFASDRELRHALRCRLAGPSFGWDGLMAPGAATCEVPLRGSDDRDGALDVVADFFGQRGLRRRLVSLLQDAAEELVTNAVYDAPVDANGKPLFASLDRRQRVELPARGAAVLTMAADDQQAAVAVRDPYGSLVAVTARRFVSKGLRGGPDQIDTKQGGAGLGLTRVYQMVDHLALRMRPGIGTEVVALIETAGARRDMASRPSSLLLAEAAR